MNPLLTQLEGTIVYSCVQKAVRGYKDPAATEEPGMEWKTSVVVIDEEYVDSLEEAMKEANAKGISIKKVKSADFEDKFKCELPEGAGSKVWVLTVRKGTTLGKTGKEVPEIYRPKIFQQIKNTRVDITYVKDKIVGNGSYGKVSIDPFTRTDGSVQLYLKNTLLSTLKVYEKKADDYEPGSEFDATPEESAPAPTPTKATPNKEKAAPKTTKPSQDNLDDDVPF